MESPRGTKKRHLELNDSSKQSKPKRTKLFIKQIGKLLTENSKLKESKRQLTQRVGQLETLKRQSQDREESLKESYHAVLHKLQGLETRLIQLERSPGPISFLPPEILYMIFHWLPLTEIVLAQSVCVQWNHSISSWLTHLNLYPFHNGINNVTLRKISKFCNLQVLSLSRCKEITTSGLEIVQDCFPNLISIDLFGCQVSEFRHLRGLKNLRKLRFGDCKNLFDKDLESLPEQLTSLKIEWCNNLKSNGLQGLSHLTNLQSLHVHQCDNLRGVGFKMPDQIVGNLKRLSMERLVHYNDNAVKFLQGCTNLKKLRLCSVPITGGTFDELAGLTSIKVLEIRRCGSFGDDGLISLSKVFGGLKVLELVGDSQITNKGILYLSNLSNLHTLKFRCGKGISDFGMSFLANLSLRVLHLYDCAVITEETLKTISLSQNNSLTHLTLNYAFYLKCLLKTTLHPDDTTPPDNPPPSYNIYSFLHHMNHLLQLDINEYTFHKASPAPSSPWTYHIIDPLPTN